MQEKMGRVHVWLLVFLVKHKGLFVISELLRGMMGAMFLETFYMELIAMFIREFMTILMRSISWGMS